MKILKKAKILPCECFVCGTVFLPNWKELAGRNGGHVGYDRALCPICKTMVDVHFELKSKKGGDK